MLKGRAEEPIEIRVKGQPPLHQCAVSITGAKHPHRERVQEFLKCAKKAMRSRALLRGGLVMEIEYTGLHPYADPVNVVAAFPNMFEGIVYENDNQIREVHCWEKQGDEAECVIRFRSR